MLENIRSNFEMLRPYEPQLWRLALRELNAAVTELRALLEELGEDPDLALDELLPDDEADHPEVSA